MSSDFKIYRSSRMSVYEEAAQHLCKYSLVLPAGLARAEDAANHPLLARAMTYTSDKILRAHGIPISRANECFAHFLQSLKLQKPFPIPNKQGHYDPQDLKNIVHILSKSLHCEEEVAEEILRIKRVKEGISVFPKELIKLTAAYLGGSLSEKSCLIEAWDGSEAEIIEDPREIEKMHQTRLMDAELCLLRAASNADFEALKGALRLLSRPVDFSFIVNNMNLLGKEKGKCAVLVHESIENKLCWFYSCSSLVRALLYAANKGEGKSIAWILQTYPGHIKFSDILLAYRYSEDTVSFHEVFAYHLASRCSQEDLNFEFYLEISLYYLALQNEWETILRVLSFYRPFDGGRRLNCSAILLRALGSEAAAQIVDHPHLFCGDRKFVAFLECMGEKTLSRKIQEKIRGEASFDVNFLSVSFYKICLEKALQEPDWDSIIRLLKYADPKKAQADFSDHDVGLYRRLIEKASMDGRREVLSFLPKKIPRGYRVYCGLPNEKSRCQIL